MRFCISLPTVGTIAGPDAITEVAQAADEAGVDSVTVPDHVVIPENVDRRYPLSADGVWRIRKDQAYFESLTSLAYVAAKTSRVRLAVNVLVLATRNPIVTAKVLATLDQLSKGRVTCGIGVGWLHSEFEALGVEDRFARRGAITDEYIRVMRACWAPGLASYKGKYWTLPEAHVNPKPYQPGGIPLFIGGLSDAAIRRAARLGDGWAGGGMDPATAADFNERLSAACAEAGRPRSEVALQVGAGGGLPEDPAAAVALIREYEAAGVDQMMVGFHDRTSTDEQPIAVLVEKLHAFKRDVIDSL